MPLFPLAAELAEVSARVGADPLLVQGPGGNSSVKSGDALWVKASGVWLSEAMQRPIFAGLSLPDVLEIVHAAKSEDFSSARLPDCDPALRPSIETALHALMPHITVLHAHAVGSMMLSVLVDGQKQAATALDGLPWAWVPYRRPGAPLAQAVQEILADKPADILILQNHGVVIGADTPRAAETLLREIERRLAFPLRPLPAAAPAPDTERYEFLSEIAALALDEDMFVAATQAALFPDQVVFLGGAVPTAHAGETVEQAALRVELESGIIPALLLVAGVGAYAARDRTFATSALIAGLFEVVRRLPLNARIDGLSAAAVAELLGWEAEAYRVKLARSGTVAH